MSSWRVKVAGVSFENADGGSRQAIVRHLRPGDIVTLRREWNNDHDVNAIAVDAAEGQIGYVPREIARRLASIPHKANAVVTEVRQSSSTIYAGVDITITTGATDGTAARSEHAGSA